MTEWWAGLGAVEAVIDCDGSSHRLRWAEGTLTAVDHDDPESERALAAIGGAPCPCIEILDAWTAHATDLHVLVLAPRGPSERLVPIQPGRPGRVPGYSAQRLGALPVAASPPVGTMIAPGGGRTVFRGVRPVRPGGAGPGAPGDQPDLVRLLHLGGGLPDRLIATVLAHWSARLDRVGNGSEDADLAVVRPAMAAALYGRAAAAVRAWLRNDDLRVTVTMIDRSAPPSLTRTPDAVSLALPFSWLPEVWSRGLATVLDRFCLSASIAVHGDRIRWDLATVGPDGGDAAPVTIEGPG
ncbi:MAG TPA: hypothetical protein VKY26_05145 [Actinomycetota bacterium]|nr:hypothetical protein [Actinomycetota bacterium]